MVSHLLNWKSLNENLCNPLTGRIFPLERLRSFIQQAFGGETFGGFNSVAAISSLYPLQALRFQNHIIFN